MPKPQTKEDLLKLSQSNYAKLLKLAGSYDEEELVKAFPHGILNRNVKDVLAHVHHWHLLMIEWYTEGSEGKRPSMPAKGYSWKQLPHLNIKIRKKYHEVEHEKVLELLEQSFNDVQAIIEKHTTEELFEKRKFAWTGSTTLGAYLISNTSTHYSWATKLIKKAKKNEL